MNVMDQLMERAAQDPKRVIFPETGEEMIYRLARAAADRGIAHPVLLGEPTQMEAFARTLGISLDGITLADTTDTSRKEYVAAEYAAVNPLLSVKAVRRRLETPLNYAMVLTRLGYVDAVAAGRVHSTGDVILAGQTFVGMQEGIRTVSSLGVLDVPGFSGSEGTLVGITDCAVNAFPTAEELCDIAIASADTVAQLFGWEARIAVLGFSTKGSSGRPEQDKLLKAVELVHVRRPDLCIDGEMQLDSALNPEVASRKLPEGSPVAGRANILLFPDLNAGNIGVKLVQNFAHANAYGPILQGFARPVTDFSRGAPLEEMLGNVAMLVVRAQESNE